jgi:hypothetical protein
MRQIFQGLFTTTESFTITPLNFQYRTIGDTGYACGHVVVAFKPKDGPMRTMWGREIFTYTNVEGQWRMVTVHASAIPTNEWSCTFSLRINWIDVSGAQVRGREERELLPDTMMPHRRCSRFTRSGGRGGFSGSPQPRVLHRSLWLTVPAAGATAGRETGARPARTIPDRSARPPSPAYMDANVWLSPCLLWAEGEPAARVS